MTYPIVKLPEKAIFEVKITFWAAESIHFNFFGGLSIKHAQFQDKLERVLPRHTKHKGPLNESIKPTESITVYIDFFQGLISKLRVQIFEKSCFPLGAEVKTEVKKFPSTPKDEKSI